MRRGFITFKIETEEDIDIFNNEASMLNQQIRVEEFLLEDIQIGCMYRFKRWSIIILIFSFLRKQGE